MTERNIILALDFDGVMHPVNSRTESKFCRLDLLEAWLRGRPSIRVLISSSWREVHPFDELVSFFSTDLQDRIAGVTPRLDVLLGKGGLQTAHNAAQVHVRQQEIEAWMAACESPVDTWAALDDNVLLFASGCPNLVACDSHVGLTEKELADLDALLYDGVWDGDTDIKLRSAKFEAEVRTGERAPETLWIFNREQVRLATVTSASEAAMHCYDWGEREERLAAEDMLSLEEASSLSGVPSAVLARWAGSDRVLGLEHVEPGMRFPRWQFTGPWRGVMPDLFNALKTKDAWVVLRWLESPNGSLEGKTPASPSNKARAPAHCKSPGSTTTGRVAGNRSRHCSFDLRSRDAFPIRTERH